MARDHVLRAIVDELKTKHGCHTVVLYGSRARGDATPTSDYDLLGVRDGGGVERDARFWQGAYLDAFIYPTEKVLAADESMLHVLGGVVLCERDRVGTDLLARLQALFQAGPKPLAPDEAGMKRVWAWKMVDRARAGDPEGHYRRHWLLFALMEDYFLLRGQWYRGPKESLRWLQTNAPQDHAAFVAALVPGADLARIERLVELVTEQPRPF